MNSQYCSVRLLLATLLLWLAAGPSGVWGQSPAPAQSRDVYLAAAGIVNQDEDLLDDIQDDEWYRLAYALTTDDHRACETIEHSDWRLFCEDYLLGSDEPPVYEHSDWYHVMQMLRFATEAEDHAQHIVDSRLRNFGYTLLHRRNLLQAEIYLNYLQIDR
jgi:hypothetical protein